MPELRVAAVMLTKDRGEMARQAVASFRAQTYDPASRMLLIFDTGDLTWYDPRSDAERIAEQVALLQSFFDTGDLTWYDPRSDAENEHQIGFTNRNLDWTIGQLRNEANSLTSRFDVIVHWDSDDWSHPNRIAEQVALLQSSGADCVGYRQMLFWRQIDKRDGEAWLYANPDPRYALGTSLCYWRRTWERKPFEALPTSAPDSANEDARFITGLNCVGVSAMDNLGKVRITDNPPSDCFDVRMIARIHAGNTSQAYDPRNMERSNKIKGGPWRRTPEWDSYCRSVME